MSKIDEKAEEIYTGAPRNLKTLLLQAAIEDSAEPVYVVEKSDADFDTEWNQALDGVVLPHQVEIEAYEAGDDIGFLEDGNDSEKLHEAPWASIDRALAKGNTGEPEHNPPSDKQIRVLLRKFQ